MPLVDEAEVMEVLMRPFRSTLFRIGGLLVEPLQGAAPGLRVEIRSGHRRLETGLSVDEAADLLMILMWELGGELFGRSQPTAYAVSALQALQTAAEQWRDAAREALVGTGDPEARRRIEQAVRAYDEVVKALQRAVAVLVDTDAGHG